MKSTGYEPIKIFISHRHEDAHVADVFKQAFELWGDGEIEVFQSSDKLGGVNIGSELDDSLMAAIANSRLVLMIYTDQHADWSWCMYECGLAQNPECLGDPSVADTKLAIFHTEIDPPAPFKNLMTIPFTASALLAFLGEIHSRPDFFPHAENPICRTVANEDIQSLILKRAKRLYEDLHQRFLHEKAEEHRRFDTLIIGLDLHWVMQIKTIQGQDGFRSAMAHGVDTLKQHARIVDVIGDPLAHFNLEAFSKGISFSEVITGWQQESEFSDLNWQEALYGEMARTILNRKERALCTAFDSLDPDTDLWVMPVVTRYRIIPNEGRVEFDVLFCTIQSEIGKKIMLAEEHDLA